LRMGSKLTPLTGRDKPCLYEISCLLSPVSSLFSLCGRCAAGMVAWRLYPGFRFAAP
jgi:hypothetical protein